jgi:hypothetical protein
MEAAAERPDQAKFLTGGPSHQRRPGAGVLGCSDRGRFGAEPHAVGAHCGGRCESRPDASVGVRLARARLARIAEAAGSRRAVRQSRGRLTREQERRSILPVWLKIAIARRKRCGSPHSISTAPPWGGQPFDVVGSTAVVGTGCRSGRIGGDGRAPSAACPCRVRRTAQHAELRFGQPEHGGRRRGADR